MKPAKDSGAALIMALSPKSSSKPKVSEELDEGDDDAEGLEEAEEVLAAMNNGDASALNDALKAHYARCNSRKPKMTY